MVSTLNEEAQREAHQNYLAKMKKKAEQERRTIKRENKRQAKLEAKMNKLKGTGLVATRQKSNTNDPNNLVEEDLVSNDPVSATNQLS